MPSMSPGFVLVVLTVTILGGTSLAGGRGNLWGTLLAAVFVSMIYYGLNLINLQVFYQMLAVGHGPHAGPVHRRPAACAT